MNAEASTCAHQSCICEVPEGQTYCSPHCANAAAEQAPGTGEEPYCGCGHPQCEQSGRDSLHA